MIMHDNFQFHPPCSIGEDHSKFQPIRGFYGPWQQCWITDRNNTWLGHENEHSCHVWSHLLQWFSRRRLKCLRTDDGRQVMAIAHMNLRVRWAKNWYFCLLYMASLFFIWFWWVFVSFYHPLESIVCLSSIHHKLLHINLLLWNHWTKLHQTWPRWFLGCPLTKLHI